MKKNRKSKLKIAFKVMLVMIILALLIFLIKEILDFLQHYDLLVKRVDKQNLQIDQLHHQLDEANQANFNLQNQLEHTKFQLDLEHQKVNDLINERLTYQEPKLSIGGQAIETPKVDIPIEKPGIINPSTLPIIIVGGLTLIRGIITSMPILIP